MRRSGLAAERALRLHNASGHVQAFAVCREAVDEKGGEFETPWAGHGYMWRLQGSGDSGILHCRLSSSVCMQFDGYPDGMPPW